MVDNQKISNYKLFNITHIIIYKNSASYIVPTLPNISPIEHYDQPTNLILKSMTIRKQRFYLLPHLMEYLTFKIAIRIKYKINQKEITHLLTLLISAHLT